MTLYEQLKLDKEYRKTQNKNKNAIIYYITFLVLAIHFIPTLNQKILVYAFDTFFVTYSMNLYISPFLFANKGEIASNNTDPYWTKFKFTPINKKIFIKSKIIILLSFSLKLFLFLEICNFTKILINNTHLLSFNTYFPLIIITISILLAIIDMIFLYRKL